MTGDRSAAHRHLTELEAALAKMREGRCVIPFPPSGAACGQPLPCPVHASAAASSQPDPS